MPSNDELVTNYLTAKFNFIGRIVVENEEKMSLKIGCDTKATALVVDFKYMK